MTPEQEKVQTSRMKCIEVHVSSTNGCSVYVNGDCVAPYTKITDEKATEKLNFMSPQGKLEPQACEKHHIARDHCEGRGQFEPQ